MLGYTIGSLDLVSIFGTSFGDTQFKKLALISTFTILFTCGVTCWAVDEKVMEPKKGDDGVVQEHGVGDAVRTIMTTLKNLPPRVQAICWANFWCWIGALPRPRPPTVVHLRLRRQSANIPQAGSPSTSTAQPGSARPTSATTSRPRSATPRTPSARSAA